MGGVENMLLSSLKWYRNKNVTIEIITKLGGELDNYFVDNEIALHDFKFKNNPFKRAFALLKLLQVNDYDLIHSHTNHTSGFYALIAYIYSIPFILSVHSQKSTFKLSWKNHFPLRFLRSFYLFFHKKMSIVFSELIIGHSKSNLLYFNKSWELYESKYRVIYNGIDFDKLNETKKPNKGQKENLFNGNLTFLHIGSFRDAKNHSFLIDCFNKLKPVENNFKLLLVGSGSESIINDIKNKVIDYKIDDNVIFVGMDKDIKPYLTKSDIFIFPSLYEGFGNVLIEAQYMGLPIIASNILPHYESVFENYHPFLFSPIDTDDCIEKVKNLIELIQHGEITKTVNRATSFAEKFTIEHMVMNFVDVYKNILKIH